MVNHEKFSPQEDRRDLDHYSNIKYRIVFVDLRTNQSRGVDYFDVYSSPGASIPTPLPQLFAAITWSPFEDFVILPEEDWPSAPGTPAYTAVNLNPNFNWSSTEVSMTEFVWIDSLTVCGNYYGECSCSVYCFNGRSGKTISIKQASSPTGYAVVSLKGQHLIIQTMVDNCASDEDRKQFRREELFIDLGDFKRLYLTQAP